MNPKAFILAAILACSPSVTQGGHSKHPFTGVDLSTADSGKILEILRRNPKGIHLYNTKPGENPFPKNSITFSNNFIINPENFPEQLDFLLVTLRDHHADL